MNTETTYDTYKGHNMVVITEIKEQAGIYPAQVKFGLKKAKLVVSAIEDIKKFIAIQDDIKAKVVAAGMRAEIEAEEAQ